MRSELHMPTVPDQEQSVIASMLGTDGCANAIGGVLSETDFFTERHRELAHCIFRLEAEGAPIAPSTLMAKWGTHGMGKPPTELELLELASHALPSDIASMLAEEVAAASRRREMIVAAATSLARLQESGSDETECLEPIFSAGVKSSGRQFEIIEPKTLSRRTIDLAEERKARGGELIGLSTGFNRIDRMTSGLVPQEFYVFGALRSQGKSAIALNIAAHVGLVLKQPTLFVTLEMSPDQLLIRLSACHGMIPATNFRDGQFCEQDFQRMSRMTTDLHRGSLHLANVMPGGGSIGGITQLARYYKSRAGIKLLVVDYLQKIRADRKLEKRNEQVGEAAAGLKMIAKSLDIAVVAPAQLSRAPEQEKRPPRLSDLADSSEIEKEADIIGLISFPNAEEDRQRAILNLAKNRMGETGLCDLKWNAPLVRFENAVLD